MKNRSNEIRSNEIRIRQEPPVYLNIIFFPVFYKDGTPNLFDGDIAAEEEVLDWLIEMNVENHIELITRPMLENMVEEIQYLAVYFCELTWICSNKVLFRFEFYVAIQNKVHILLCTGQNKY